MHFGACILGMGIRGQTFSELAAASLLAKRPKGSVITNIQFGASDHSLPEGDSFWDYQNDKLLAIQSQRYVTEKRDRVIAQKGRVRVASYNSTSKRWTSTLSEPMMFIKMNEHFAK